MTMDEHRHQLIKLDTNEAQEALLKLWNGELGETAEQFSDETGEDFEQCLVEFITENKCCLDRQMVETIINRFKNNDSFYELAHMLINCIFEAPIKNLNESQKYVLRELRKHDVIWNYDMYFPDLLASLDLPNTKESLINYLKKV